MKATESIYLDHAATTPVREEVFEAMRPYLTRQFGNAGSAHRFGRDAKKAIDHARDQAAELINADPRDLIFTSGGTEANNLAIRGSVPDGDGAKVLASAVEHRSVLHAVSMVELAPVNAQGKIRMEEFIPRLEGKELVCVMQGNNETGTLQPIEGIGEPCWERGVLFHTDAVQSAGKIAIDVNTLPVDLLSFSAHKLYGPKGIGALFVRRGIKLAAQLAGGSQERGRRAGTENVAGIVGFGVACELAGQELESESRRQRHLLQALEAGILERIPGSWVNGSRRERLPHILNIGLPGMEAEEWMLGLDVAGIAVSTGSTCASGSVDASHVLLAMGQDHRRAHSGLRFSLGRGTKEEDIERVCEALAGIFKR